MSVNFILLLILFKTLFLCKSGANIVVKKKGILPTNPNSVAMQFYLELENLNHDKFCEIRGRSTKCCFVEENTSAHFQECHRFDIYGAASKIIPPKSRVTVNFMYPSVYHYDKQGYCSFRVWDNCSNLSTWKKLETSIDFDTKLFSEGKKRIKYSASYTNAIKCESLDQNPLDSCNPVDCDMKYDGAKPFFDHENKKCVEVTICLSNSEQDFMMPDKVYDPRSNTCKYYDNIFTEHAALGISSGLEVKKRHSDQKEAPKILIYANCSTLSEKFQFLLDMIYGELHEESKNETERYEKYIKAIVLTMVLYLMLLSMMILTCLSCTKLACFWTSHWKKSTKNRKSCPRYKYSRIKEDIPLKLRENAISICDRMQSEVRWKKRYRMNDLGSQLSYFHNESESDESYSGDR